MRDACDRDTNDRSMGCFGVSRTHSDDQSISLGFMVVVVVQYRCDADPARVSVAGFGILRISAHTTHKQRS